MVVSHDFTAVVFHVPAVNVICSVREVRLSHLVSLCWASLFL